jgi:hypothetical protein
MPTPSMEDAFIAIVERSRVEHTPANPVAAQAIA